MLYSDMLLSDAIRSWLRSMKSRVDSVTLQGYQTLADTQLLPYFDETATEIQKVTPELLQDYFDEKALSGRRDGKGGLSARTLKLHWNILNQTLNEAVKNKLLPTIRVNG